MYTREDFQQAIDDSVARYPAVGALYRARDPRILQHLDAMATMLAMYSQQLEVSLAEPFEKVRDATVLADASMRGLVPKAKPAQITVKMHNPTGTAFAVAPGRSMLDAAGRPFRVETPAEVGPGETTTFEAVQLHERARAHVVQGSRAFYAVELDMADDDSWLCGLHVTDADGAFEYRERYTNTLAGERIYHVEADERQRVYVRFGQSGVVGVQPSDGRQLTITTYYSLGRIDDFRTGSPMAFEAMQDPVEAQLEMTLEVVASNGENPPSMRALRELAKYPSVYNHNAVFLGEFDFLVRRHFPSLSFLSVWNEGVEERHRGMSVDNINALFVACLSGTGDETVLTQQPGEEVEPQLLDDESLTATQLAIRERIHAADDSYRVRFYTPIRAPLAVAIDATVATSYDESVVRDQIRQVMLDEFGEQADQSRRGQSAPLYQQVYQLLRQRVPALSVGRADLKVAIEDPAGAARPELWRYVSPESLDVNVTVGNVNVPFWGSGL
ncbi:hypothetical protein [Halomonas sp. E14]|uniref:hypothetical protein n=1 Tax=Halomonas sp. E14 TaxID=3397245 RepID=UPI00403E71C4